MNVKLMKQLNEISIADKYNLETKSGKNRLPFGLYKQLIEMDPTTKNDKVGKLSNWILAKYDIQTDLSELRIALEWYADGIKRNILQREGVSSDINTYKSYAEFLSIMQDKMKSDTIDLSNSELNNREKLKSQYEVIGSTSKFDIIKPLTFDAERYFGSDTKWCTVANKRYFDSYMKKSPLYIIYPKNGDSNLKMQFHEQSELFADKNDRLFDNITDCIYSIFEENDKDAIELRNLCKKLFKPELIGLTINEKIESLKNMEEIPNNYFCNANIKSIVIPNNIKKIEYSAFCGCTSLESITIPDSVTSIEYSAFSDCSSLASITIPSSVTSIGDRAFYYCSDLTHITIPDSVTKIGDDVLVGCPRSVNIKCSKKFYNYFKSEFPDAKITINNTNEHIDDKSILINLLEKYGKDNIINYLNESYHTKSKRNISTDNIDNVFMTPSDEFDTEMGKFEYDSVPEKMAYSDLMSVYDDFCSNYIDAYDTQDEHWTFIYQDGKIINQDGDNGKIQVSTNTYDKRYEKRIEKKLLPEDRFKPIQKRGLVAIIWSNSDEERYWYKDVLGKELLTKYTGWSFEQPGDEWL